MSLFNWFKDKRQPDVTEHAEDINTRVEENTLSAPETVTNNSITETPVEIPENIFVEFEKPSKPTHMEPTDEKDDVNDLKALYKFLEQSHEKKGYEDALMNPDTSSMEEQVVLLQNGLSLMLSKVKTHYSTYLRNIDFHLETRKRNGMVETVDELETHKQNIKEEISIVQAIEQEALKSTGLSQNMILSYRRGFKNGFAAITFNNILSRKS